MKNRITAGIICLFLVLMSMIPTAAWATETEQKTVRVGYVNVPTYEEGGEGEYKRGYGYEYLQKISYLTGWKYEYVYGTFKECLDMLANGEIDLFGNVSYTPERAELINFSSYPQGKDTYLLYMTREKAELMKDDISQLSQCKIGVTEGSYQEGLLKEWISENKFQSEVIYCNGYDALMEALDSGKVDAIATPNLSLTYDYMPVISIGFSDYYFGVSKSRLDLLKELNVALYDIQNSELDYNNLLVSRYQKKMSNSLMLDDEEKQWLDDHGNTIKLGYLNDNLPYSIQSEEGEMLGVMKNLKDTLEQELKVTVQTQCYETCRELTSALEQGKVDAIGPVYSDFYLAEGKNYVLTNSFITTTPVMIFKNPDPSTNSDVIAVSNESLLPEDVVSLLYPDAELYVCDGIEECLKAVVSGKANSTLVTSVRLNVLRQYDEMHELQFADTSVQSEICLATTKEHRVSAGILNKGILLASDTFNGVALAENSYVEKEVSFGDYVRSHMMAVFAGAGIIILFLALMAYKLFVNGRKLSVALEEAKREKEHAYELYLNNNELKIKASQDAMTNIGNRYHFFKKIDELLEQKEKFALCYCDLDNLKIINDRYGHSEGDCYIRGFVSIIKRELKSEDVFARMGGDEFCIIFKNCDYETTAEKMKQLQSTFRNEHEKCYLKNFSFGIIEISENYDEIDVMDILKQVDERMYDQKKEHKKEQSGLLTGIPERQES